MYNCPTVSKKVGQGHVYHVMASPIFLTTVSKRLGPEETSCWCLGTAKKTISTLPSKYYCGPRTLVQLGPGASSNQHSWEAKSTYQQGFLSTHLNWSKQMATTSELSSVRGLPFEQALLSPSACSRGNRWVFSIIL